ncbi:MAG: alcohol dehydrogenase catalytic domain-containing protein [Aeromonas sp.]
MPQQTQAWCWSGANTDGQLSLETKTLPPLGALEVRVANRVIGLNPVDWKLITYGHNAWQPGHVPGVDGMGVIVALGRDVTHLRLGQRVAYHTDLRYHGSFAQHTQVPARAILPVPDALSDAAAAAMPCPALTAWQALAKLPTSVGEALLITGAGSNVGRWTVQLAHAQGWRVFANASPRHHAWLKRQGVYAVADYAAENWLAQLQAANGGEPFTAIIDLVSSQQAQDLLPALGYYGHLVAVLGRVEHNPLPAFNHCHSLHEIALGAAHVHASDRQWAQLVAASQQLFAHVSCGQLQLPPLQWQAFADLPAALHQLKTVARGEKFLLSVGDLPAAV